MMLVKIELYFGNIVIFIFGRVYLSRATDVIRIGKSFLIMKALCGDQSNNRGGEAPDFILKIIRHKYAMEFSLNCVA